MTDWIEWHGGEQPVADDVVVEVVLRCETIEQHDPSTAEAAAWRWNHNDAGGDIIAYRIVSQDSDLDRLRAELEALKTGIATYVRISSEQTTENEGLRKENAALREQRGMCYSQGMPYIDDDMHRRWQMLRQPHDSRD